MEASPLNDTAEPVACTIGAEEVPARIEQFGLLRKHLVTIERTEHGLLLRFPATPAIDAELHRFAVDEKRCCAFWDFSVVADGDELTLRWGGPPAAAVILDQLLAWFEGDAPLTGLVGLL